MTGGSAVAFVDPDNEFTRRRRRRPSFRELVEPVDMYRVGDGVLDGFAGVVVSSQVDQEHLYANRNAIRSHLDEGGVLAFSGHLSRRWLPGAGLFKEMDVDSPEDYRVEQVRDHPIFEGVDDEALTLQKGVAGFFARGHNPPPDGAEVVCELAGGQPVVYVDRVSTEGTILAHSGNDLIAFGSRPSSASRVPEQLVGWIEAEARRRGAP